MKRRFRLGVLLCVSLVGLAFAGSAAAQFTPRLSVSHLVPRVGAGGTTVLNVKLAPQDEAIARLAIYAPLGYQATLSQAPGTQIGQVRARIQARQVGPEVIVPVQGTIVVANAADPSIRAAATTCTGTPTHAAVWVLVLTAQGRELRVPVYLDPAAGGETAFASSKLVACLPPPDVPEAQGGAALGAKLVAAELRINGVFTNPASRGEYIWRGVFTPWTAHRPPTNVAGTVEARSFVRLPVQLTMGAKALRGRRIQVSGTVSEFGVRSAGSIVGVFVGNRLRGAKRATAGGVYRFTIKMKKSGRYTIRVVATLGCIPGTDNALEMGCERDFTSRGCAVPGAIAPRGCVSATLAPYAVLSRALRVRVRR